MCVHKEENINRQKDLVSAGREVLSKGIETSMVDNSHGNGLIVGTE